MANTLLGASVEDLDSVAYQDLYTAPGGTISSVISVVFANKSASPINVNFKVVRVGGTPESVYMQGKNIPVGEALEAISARPITLNTGDKIQGQASAVAACDVTLSILNQT